MRSVCFVCAFAGALIASVAQGAGFAHNDNFIVLAPDQALAEEVLDRAEDFRALVAQEWLDEELPPSVGRAVIHVSLSDWEDSGLTWAIDCPERKYHKLWVKGTRDQVLGSTLRHEIVHMVLVTRFPDQLPVWAEEGAASSVDDPQRIGTRRRIIDWYARTGNWPGLAAILDARSIVGRDQANYSVAASLTEYLLSHGDRAKFLRFAIAGKKDGWDNALQKHYGIPSVRHLQTAWQAWAGKAPDTKADLAADHVEPLSAGAPLSRQAAALK